MFLSVNGNRERFQNFKSRYCNARRRESYRLRHQANQANA